MVVAIIILVGTLLIGIPVPFSFFATSIYLVMTKGYESSFLLPYGFGQLESSVLLAIPLFIMAGGLIEKGGLGDKLIMMVDRVFGKIKGGLGIVTVISSALFGAISGSGAAAMTTIGTILLPRLEKEGYPPGFSASLVASSSVLGMLIPPSSLMILFAWVASQSVLAAFLSTVIPGFIMIICLSAINIIYLRNEDIEVSSSPKKSGIPKKKKNIGSGIKDVFPIFLLAFIILGGIYGGVLTVTEAAAVSVVYVIPVGFWVYKKLNIKSFFQVLIDSAKMTGIIMVMLFGSMILGRMFIMEDLPGQLTDLFLTVSDNKLVILLMINLFLIVIGMLMDDVSAVLLTTPILLPIAVSFGVDPIHFAAILSVNIGLGVVTPPAAPLLYLAGQMANTRIDKLIKPTLVMIAFAWIPTLIITTYIPEVALFLPRLLLGY